MNSYGRGENKNDGKKTSILTHETVGMTLLLFGAIIFFIAVTGPYIFGDPGVAITAFFLGLFGFFFYPFDLFIVYLGISFVSGKRFISIKWILKSWFVLLSVFFIVHLATSGSLLNLDYGKYLGGCWNAAGKSVSDATGGGVLLGLLVYPLAKLLSVPGAYVAFSLLLVLALFLIVKETPLKRFLPSRKKLRKQKEEEPLPTPVTFDDLKEPVHTSAPYDAQPAYMPQSAPTYAPQPAPSYSPQPAPMYAPQPAPYEDPQSEAAMRARSRELLFGSGVRRDYSSQSEFGASQTGATTPDTSSFGGSASPREGYADRYAKEAETAHPSMPRKVTSVPKTYAPRNEAYDYPPPPSYRAPEPPSRTATDAAKPISETPARPSYQAPISETPTRPIYQAPISETPTRPSYQASISETPMRPSYQAPISETPARPSYQAPISETPARPSYQAPISEIPARPSYQEPEQTEPPILPRGESTRDSARSFPRREPSEETRFTEPTDDEDESRIETAFRNLERARRSEPEEEPTRTSGADLFDNDDLDDIAEPLEPDLPTERAPIDRARAPMSERTPMHERTPMPAPAPKPAPQPAPKPAPVRRYRPYIHPSESLLKEYPQTKTVSTEEIESNCQMIVETLENFGITVSVKKVTCGPAVTRYEIDIPVRVPVRDVLRRSEEISLRLKSKDVNMYSNNENGTVAIEVPNRESSTVGLVDIMRSPAFREENPKKLIFAIGKNMEGNCVCGDVVDLIHILVAGGTGSGKSVCLNCMIISLICKYSPEDLRLILVDPKKVEFSVFEGLPHLMINEIISDANKTVAALNWAIKEMERRYDLFTAKKTVRKIEEYNEKLEEGETKLPRIIIVVDELADLMSVAKKDIEERIQRLAQKARAAGIYLVLATQRPSVDVITGVIKSNLTTRFAFKVRQYQDSVTILGEQGAEKLLGCGDMFLSTSTSSTFERIQSAFISGREVEAIVEDIKANNDAFFDDSVAEFINQTQRSEAGDAMPAEAADPNYIKALAAVIKAGSASISLIQRKFSLGYHHAGKIIEWMELMGYISPFEGKAKPRTVLITQEEFDRLYGDQGNQ